MNKDNEIKIDIDFALVEENRPSIYRAMKYWGKKPHNIWREYIKHYTPKDGVYLDPFVGSGISVLESLKAGRRAIGFDLNPLSSFMIEVLSSKFNEDIFEKKVINILNNINRDKIYTNFFSTNCTNCGKRSVAQNFKWEGGVVYEIGVECSVCYDKKKNVKKDFAPAKHWNGEFKRFLKTPDKDDVEIIKKIDSIDVPFWFPEDSFPNSPSFTNSFIKCIGGTKFKNLWTKRNLYVISHIFNQILSEPNDTIRKQLLFGFIQTIHLCTKMSVPRRAGAKRPFSTSWGRSGYLCTNRQMEMNPLLLFESSCLGKQSVRSSLKNNYKYLGKEPKTLLTNKSNKSNRSKNYDIKYGVIDISTLSDYIDNKSIDFIMTDPPYGGLVQYLDLSSIWLIWLKKIDSKYTPNYEAEITIKKDIQEKDSYERKFLNGLKQLNKVLKDDGKIVFTFHNKDVGIWNSFLRAIMLAGFSVEKVIHQQNRRTGESNVSNPYGTSGTDFYIRCKKNQYSNLKNDDKEWEHFVVTKAIEIIALRNEPTPYQILFNGLLAQISGAGFNLENFDSNIEKILSNKVGEIFKIIENNNTNAGKYWWLNTPDKYIRYRDKKLSERVEETIVSLLRRKVSVAFDEVLADIFIKYPNGLTPDIRSVSVILEKYAYKSGGKWIYKGDKIERDFTEHTRILFLLNKIGTRLNLDTFIGKREQPEPFEGKKLGDFAKISSLDFPHKYDTEQVKRIEMIDMLWIDSKKIKFAIEVENSTNFTSGIQRGSNLEQEIRKIMVLPDSRKSEFSRQKDPLFLESFKKYNWGYLFYSDVEDIYSKQHITDKVLEKYIKIIK